MKSLGTYLGLTKVLVCWIFYAQSTGIHCKKFINKIWTPSKVSRARKPLFFNYHLEASFGDNWSLEAPGDNWSLWRSTLLSLGGFSCRWSLLLIILDNTMWIVNIQHEDNCYYLRFLALQPIFRAFTSLTWLGRWIFESPDSAVYIFLNVLKFSL